MAQLTWCLHDLVNKNTRHMVTQETLNDDFILFYCCFYVKKSQRSKQELKLKLKV